MRIEVQIIFLAILALLFIVPKIMPLTMSGAEKEYMAHFNSAYELYQNDKCQEAIDEYRKAEQIRDKDAKLYVYLAYSYKCLKDYDNAIINAKKSLERKDSKTYRKFHGFMFKFVVSDDIAAYTIIGDSSLKLKKYQEAKDAFTYVINHVKYTYTDAYYKRGKCEFYLGETKEALDDFNHHKEIIQKYFDDQAESEYKDVYPTYTEKDMVKIEKWINKTINKF